MTVVNQHKGFTLVELMIALALSLILLAGVIGVFISNQNTARATTDLSNLQNSTRLAFQLLSQDIRSAGFSGCNNATRDVSLIQVAGVTPAWADWIGGLQGFAADANGNESIRLMYGTGTSSSVVTHAPPVFTLSAAPALQAGDIALVCDDTLTSIFQVSAVGATNLSHAVAGTMNCSADLGIIGDPFVCAAPRPKLFGADSMILRLESVRWFVGPGIRNNAIRSLFRETVIGGQVVAEEVLAGVASLTFQYSGQPFALVPFSAALNMGNMVAVNVNIVLDQAAFPNIQLAAEQRTITFLAAVRNRL
ncbi:prepilin-type N-terminal cleavage/methylation domain-containing protein [Rheinheimera muenzenbergensis]|uniref:Prepilin-type N-terminal cleavage/methylation domain-containing protein n=1 Tax=Rheinheimera muenzenbergensis TaxID=1193628 RepID=A0ABU8CA37_9GAMM